MKQDISIRFWSKVEIGQLEECWPWKAYKIRSGHGQTYFRGKVVYAHRLAFFLTHGVMPNVCRHTCDNGSCCNPRHLLDGTTADNVKDMNDRGRNYFSNKKHCPHGHPYSGDNLVVYKDKRRRCRSCRLEAKRKFNKKQKQK